MKSILIVGHGLAAAILAHTLIDRGLRVTCTDGGINHSASRIAAGLINPFIGPKLNIPLDFQQCIVSNSHFFKKWEDESNEILFKPESLLRIFKSEKQRTKWNELSKYKESRYTLSFKRKIGRIRIHAMYGAGEPKPLD